MTVTQLGEAAVIASGGERYAPVAGTVEEQVGRCRELADAGVQQAFVALHDVVDPSGSSGAIDRVAEVIAAFR